MPRSALSESANIALHTQSIARKTSRLIHMQDPGLKKGRRSFDSFQAAVALAQGVTLSSALHKRVPVPA